MELIDFAVNDLLRPVPEAQPLRFLPGEHAEVYRSALNKLSSDGYHVVRVNLSGTQSQTSLFAAFSNAISAPSPINSWGVFGDWVTRFSWLPDAKGHIFYMENALSFWQTQTLLAGALGEELQLAVLFWKARGLQAKAVFELR